MIKNCVFPLFILLTFFACGQSQGQQNSAEEQGKEQYFGEKISAEGAISYPELLKQMNETDSISTKVLGTVESVCQVKGCWMNIVSTNPEDPDMFVKFKDYGFFMPLDIAGRQVVMEGYAFKEVTPVDELRHYAEDEGKSEEEIAAITEPKEELKFMASGVVLVEK
ncbi:MAG: DUF4920 domain-containing protein [Bacteroidota bacterium]